MFSHIHAKSKANCVNYNTHDACGTLFLAVFNYVPIDISPLKKRLITLEYDEFDLATG